MHMHCSKIALKMFKFKVVQHTVHPLNQTFTLLASSPLLLRCSTPGLRWGLLLVPYTIYSRPLFATTVVLCGWFQPNSRFISYSLRRSSSSCRVVLREKAPRSSLQISLKLWIAFRCNLGSPSCWSTCLRTQNFWIPEMRILLSLAISVCCEFFEHVRHASEQIWTFTEWLPDASVFLIGDYHTFPNTPLVGQCWTKLPCRAPDSMAACWDPHRPVGALYGVVRPGRAPWPHRQRSEQEQLAWWHQYTRCQRSLVAPLWIQFYSSYLPASFSSCLS